MPYFRLTNFQTGEDPEATWTIQTNLDESTGVGQVQSDKVQSTKVLRGGMLFIERNGRIYNAQGAEVK